ncbi:hypothetical protein YC2023_050876 [Brassica napus]
MFLSSRRSRIRRSRLNRNPDEAARASIRFANRARIFHAPPPEIVAAARPPLAAAGSPLCCAVAAGKHPPSPPVTRLTRPSQLG